MVIDGSTVNTIDSTGAETIEALARDLARQGIRLGLAGFRTETRYMLERAGAMAAIGTDSVYPTLKSAMSAFLAVRPDPLHACRPASEARTPAAGEEGAQPSDRLAPTGGDERSSCTTSVQAVKMP